jgi:hypothetical protein
MTGASKKNFLTVFRCLDTLDSAIITQALYYYFVSNFSNPQALAHRSLWQVFIPQSGFSKLIILWCRSINVSYILVACK